MFHRRCPLLTSGLVRLLTNPVVPVRSDWDIEQRDRYPTIAIDQDMGMHYAVSDVTSKALIRGGSPRRVSLAL